MNFQEEMYFLINSILKTRFPLFENEFLVITTPYDTTQFLFPEK